MRGGGVRIEGESGAEGNEGGIFRSTLAASEWPAEKREGPRGPGYCLHAVDPLRLDKKEREREREKDRVTSSFQRTLFQMANRLLLLSRSWYRRIIRFVTRYRITLAVYLRRGATRETSGGKILV